MNQKQKRKIEKRSNLMLVITIVIFALLTCACSMDYTGANGEIRDKAINYIVDKYQFTPRVLSIDEDTNYQGLFLHEKNGNYIVECSYDNKTFDVYVEEDVITDNYQKDEIINDLKEYFEQKIEGTILNVSATYGRSYKEYRREGLMKEFYKKDDLKSVLSIPDLFFRVSVEVVSPNDLQLLQYDEVVKEISELTIVNYKTGQDYDKATTHDYMNYFNEIAENAMILKDALYIKVDETKYCKFDLSSYDGIYWLYDGKSTSGKISLSKTSTPDVKNWIGHGASDKVKAISNAYKIENTFSEHGILYLYFPKKMLSSSGNLNNVEIGIQNNDQYYTVSLSEAGDYYVGSFGMDGNNSLANNIAILLLQT